MMKITLNTTKEDDIIISMKNWAISIKCEAHVPIVLALEKLRFEL